MKNTIVKYVCGIDCGKDHFDACLIEMDHNLDLKVKATHKYANTEKGFKELILWLKKHMKEQRQVETILEATGVYHEKLAIFLQESAFIVKIVLPNKARKFMQAIGHKSKNDHSDAKGLAMMCAQVKIEVWQPMSRFFYELRQCTRHYQSLQEAKTALSNQLHAIEHSAYSSKEVVKQLRSTITLLDKQIEQMREVVTKKMDENNEVKEKVKNISQIKGVAITTIAAIIAETNGFALFKSISQLTSYAGYDVVENQSGKHVGKTKISKKGNGRLRRALYMPALNVVRYNVYPFKGLYERIYDRTRIKMKGYVAVQKKLLSLIFTLWKKNEAFVEGNNKLTSGDVEQVPSFSLVFEKDKKIAPEQAEATQDGHLSKFRSLPSFS